eukprot:13385143-Alexandrium_andersonii.AAC.1
MNTLHAIRGIAKQRRGLELKSKRWAFRLARMPRPILWDSDISKAARASRYPTTSELQNRKDAPPDSRRPIMAPRLKTQKK